jgi:hypothetical protein
MLLARELRRVNGSTENTGHAVLGGVEGTGKTTLLRAVCIAVAVLMERMVPVTFTFSADSPVLPSALVEEASAALQLPAGGIFPASTSSAHRALECLRHGNHDAFLVLDEFQHVFRLPNKDRVLSTADDAALRRRISVAAEVETVSRYGGSFGLVAGSSADMRTLMFRRGSCSNPDIWRAEGYPDFNGSLYQLYTVPALRSSEELTAFVQRRYPHWSLTEADAAELLYYTGGIGRTVHAAYALSTQNRASGCAPDTVTNGNRRGRRSTRALSI